ncbi:NADP-dependent oxidoreductase domain-containing protein [Glomus cerebriforme]|uniref:NADP-dependent oxidoreductase domain-containing protein n=1 Tax=Glomus cerebriforme TaxID=658196 RepID=A0A397SET7_9GLOM|nr:NADP-dependent oxidoreductase domain-containing protein [Glomus cerebriforme]
MCKILTFLDHNYLIACACLLDTGNIYNDGQCERFLGEYVADKRSEVVIATKFTGNITAMRNDIRYNPNAGGNHRKSLVENLDESLKRLNMRYVDILYIHLYEYRTPIEEIMRSLDDVIRSGKTLYIAASNTPSWALARSNTMAELRGWSPFIGLQTHYNLLNRWLEVDLQPACAEVDVGIIPLGSIAQGFLSGKYTRESVIDPNHNRAIAGFVKDERNWKILDEVIAISKEINRTPAQVSLNWVKQKPGITSPIIGSGTVAQFEENLKALEFKLTPEQMARLDAVSKLPEIPFPHSFNSRMDNFFGKGIEMPKKFQPIVNINN